MKYFRANRSKGSQDTAQIGKRLFNGVMAILLTITFTLVGFLPVTNQGIALANTQGTPNILVIMGDDIGWTNVSAYEKGIVGYDTPNIDRIANEGMLFTDYYAEQSCTAGRASFITGQSGLRTGLLKVGFPGAPFGIQDEDPTLAEMLKPLGYTSGQFGKNHLGDQNQFLPTVHGFDEFFGNLYHLNAEEEPDNVDYPGGRDSDYAKYFGPRGVLDCEATPGEDHDEPIMDSELSEDEKYLERFGKLGYQECRDTGPLDVERMKTVDEEFLKRTKKFIKKAVKKDKPFFAWFNSTRMHYYTHIKDEVVGISGQGFYNDGMVEHDGHVGELLDFLKNQGIEDNTIVIYTTDNGPHYNQWPDGALTPFRGEKNTNWEGGYRVPALVRWPGHIPAGTVSHEIFSHLDWVPTLMAAAGMDDLKENLKQPCPYDESTNLCGTHLDGYNQLPYLSDPDSQKGQRQGFIYFNDEGQLPGVRVGDWKVVFSEQRAHYFDVWREPFVKLRVPKLFNLRRDPYERADTDSNNYNEWWSRRNYLLLPASTLVQQFLDTFDEYPPSQPPFGLHPDEIIDDIVDQIKAVSVD
ncbi:arylsulfatase [Moorena producens PAL-8-15-08-1]|uniref:Arylsulfatase n=1 Tax=Moorena producens PAL-8-15-08-1 TaxID=1458985 RepID=A0A1D8TQ00_9CYAN|nr:arylsulfatase [Moorena producens]AOW99729.1 arylsulfatase [Moorena producens PAL-8-15-08-1]